MHALRDDTSSHENDLFGPTFSKIRLFSHHFLPCSLCTPSKTNYYKDRRIIQRHSSSSIRLQKEERKTRKQEMTFKKRTSRTRSRPTLLQLLLPSVVALCATTNVAAAGEANTNTYEHCIVGAGPGGLQLARFLQLGQSNYVVLERNEGAGSFFTKYPIHEKLVSINKKNTGLGADDDAGAEADMKREFNLRHDWNSLLTHQYSNGTDFAFTDFTNEYWPHRDDMVQYLRAYAQHYELNIHYQTSVKTVVKDDELGIFSVLTTNQPPSSDEEQGEYQCEKLIWATGLSKPRVFDNEYITPYHEVSAANSHEQYKNKTVAIIGSGQSAFELASEISKVSAMTMVICQTPPRFAYHTHYAGDLRAINHEIADSYQLKSLDVISNIEGLSADVRDDFFATQIKKDPTSDKVFIATRNSFYFDAVISAIGWSLDSNPLQQLQPKMMKVGRSDDQYPKIDPTYQSTNVQNLYFAGALTHGLDKGKSAGGFIHGFRYTTRALSRILLATEERPWPVTPVACLGGDDDDGGDDNNGDDVYTAKFAAVELMTNRIMERLGSTSGLYQMQSKLQDVYVYQTDGCLIRYEEVPKRYTPKLTKKILSSTSSSTATTTTTSPSAIFTIQFEYNEEFTKPNRYTFDSNRLSASENIDIHIDIVQNGKLAFEVQSPSSHDDHDHDYDDGNNEKNDWMDDDDDYYDNGWMNNKYSNNLHPVLQMIQYGTNAESDKDDNNDINNVTSSSSSASSVSTTSDCSILLNERFHLQDDSTATAKWNRMQDKVPIMEWLLVRTMDNPCQFDTTSMEGNYLRRYWDQLVGNNSINGGRSSNNNKENTNTVPKEAEEEEMISSDEEKITKKGTQKQVEINAENVKRVDRNVMFKSL